MRALVFFLILVNLMFFAWTQGVLGGGAEPDAVRMNQQLRAEQIRVVGPEGPAVEPAPKAAKADKRESESCLLLSELPQAEKGRIDGLLREKWPGLKIESGDTAAPGSYWVYIPPLANKAEAERKASELKRLKVPEFFVLQEPAAQRFAISLGLFSSQEAAEARLEELRGKGVRSARVSEREARPTQAWFEISGAETSLESVRQSVAESVPKAKVTACKAPRPASP